MATGEGASLTTTPGQETFAEPLDALLAEHFRQRAMCDLLDRLAEDPTGPRSSELARTILTYLREQLPLHVLDEERDLFQMLRDRTLAAEAIEEAFAQLRREHAEDERVAMLVTRAARVGGGQDAPRRCRRPPHPPRYRRAPAAHPARAGAGTGRALFP